MATLTRDLKAFEEERFEIEELTSLSVGMENLLNKCILFQEDTLKLLNLLKHSHKLHHHLYKHSETIIDDSYDDENSSGYFFKRVNPKLEYINLELYSKQDLTSNNLLYGTEFYFKDDSSTPDGIKFINSDIRFDKPDKYASWNNYLSYVLKSILNCQYFNPNLIYEIDEVDIIQETIINIPDINNIIKNFILETKYNSDLDGNGLIYGYDFIILEINQKSKYLQIITSYTPNIEKLTLHQYLTSIHIISDAIIMLKIPHILEPELISILIQEFQTHQDVDSDGYIYGKDILILDPPLTLASYIPPYIPETVITWNAFKQCYNIYLEATDKIRTSDYYINLLLLEYSTYIDKDYNSKIYNRDFIITNDIYKPEELKAIKEDSRLPQLSFKDYLETLPFQTLNNSEDSGTLCVRLAHEFSNREDLIDVDNNGIINGLDFIISDCDPNKFDSLINLEKTTMFSLYRDNLRYIKCKYFPNINILATYTQIEFDTYWETPSSLIDDIQDSFGRTIEDNQIKSVCCPIWVSKTSLWPLFIPILSLYDFEHLLSINKVNLTVIKIGNGNIDSVPKLINCGSICTCEVIKDSRVTLFAYPSYGYNFLSWSGFDNCDVIKSSNESSCPLIMFNSKTITATFILKKYTLKIFKINGDGLVTDVLNSINCPTNCAVSTFASYVFDHGTIINLTVSEYSDWKFDIFDGITSVSGTTGTVQLFSDLSINIKFIKLYTLTINSVLDPNPIIDVFLDTIKQSIAISYVFNENDSISIYATPSLPYKFDRIEGGDSTAGNVCYLTMNSNKTITVYFSIKQLYLTVIKSGGDGTVIDSLGYITCGDTCKCLLPYNTINKLTVSANQNYEFLGWSGSDDDSSSNSCTVTMLTHKNIFANFKHVKKTLTIQKTGTGFGTVKNLNIGVNCGSICIYDFDYDSNIELIATPNTGSEFIKWENEDTSIDNKAFLKLTDNKTIIAEFNILKYTLDITIVGSGNIKDPNNNIDCNLNCSKIFNYGDLINLVATPNSGYTFSKWEDNSSALSKPQFSLTTNKSVIATFIQTFDLTINISDI